MTPRLPALLLTALLAATLAGCLDDEGTADGTESDMTDDAADAGDGVEVSAAGLPDDIHDEQFFPAGSTLSPVCAAECTVFYDFVTGVNASVQIDLAWTSPHNDFDLFLWRAGNVEEQSLGVGTTSEAITANLQPGEYRIEVSPYAVVGGSFVLDAVFEQRA